jgi:signal peptidase I
MISSVERYSSSSNKRTVSVVGGRLVRVVIIALALYLVVSRFLASTYRIESVSMEPTLAPADRVVVSAIAFGPRVPLSRARFPGLQIPERGDLVVVQPPFLEEWSVFSRLVDPLATFFSLQKGTVHHDLYGSRVNGYMVKRIVGMPGDTVRLKGYALSIRPRGASEFVTEEHLISVRYQTVATPTGKGWSAALPLSGESGEITLGDDQYFVLGDNRPFSSDSRSWGAVTLDRIVGKVIYRYWPANSLGKL